MNQQELYDAAKLAVSDPDLIAARYVQCLDIDTEIQSDPDYDSLADAMTIEAIYKHLTGKHVACPLKNYSSESDPKGYTVYWVVISTGEAVPVFVPDDNSLPIISEW